MNDRPADDGNLQRTESLSSLARTMLDQIRARRRILAFPAVVLAFLLAFTALGLSGSSSPLLSVDGGASDSVIVGTPRTIRSDEWIVHTPMVISQVENGAPRFGDVGVGSHDMSILSDLPVFDWLSVFHPNLWAYYVLPVDNAFAFDWWSVAAILLIGTYFFLYVLLRSIRWSIAGALLLYGSPFFHWWYTSSVFTSVGWMAFAMACLILAVSSTGVRRAVLVGLTAYAVVCFALIIYPPWQIAAAIAIAAVTLGALWASWRHSSVSIRSILGSSAVAGGLALLPLLAFYVTRRPAIQAIGQTVYPGSRVVGGGTFPWTQLSSGWFGMSYVRNGPAIRGLLFPNESEASSFLLLGVALLVALPLLWKYLAPVGEWFRAVIVTTVAAMLLFLVQMLVGLPSIVAKVTLLSTVPERRTLLGLGVVSAVLVVVVGFLLERHAVPTVAKAVSTAVVVLASGFGVITLARDLTSLTSSAGSKLVMAAVVAAIVTAGLYFWRPFIAVSLIIAFGLIVSLSANPLIRGMSQTRASNVVEMARTLDEASGGIDGWVAETYPLSSLLTTAGVRNLSGVNLYPNVPAWEILDPDREYEFAWNRYSQAVWSFDTTLAEPVVRLVQLDMVEVKVDPCDPVLDRFALRHLVTTRELSASCLHSPIDVVGPEGIRVYFYERDMVGGADPDGWTVR